MNAVVSFLIWRGLPVVLAVAGTWLATAYPSFHAAFCGVQ